MKKLKWIPDKLEVVKDHSKAYWAELAEHERLKELDGRMRGMKM